MLKPIKTSKQHQAYLESAYELMQKDSKPKSQDFYELESHQHTRKINLHLCISEKL
jgi:hypothetical protein